MLASPQRGHEASVPSKQSNVTEVVPLSNPLPAAVKGKEVKRHQKD